MAIAAAKGIDMSKAAVSSNHGIPTPYNEYTYHIIKAIEEKNDGKFDYSKDNGNVTCAK
mgnify:CR=1 FL=1